MHAHCIASCVALGARFDEAASRRELPHWGWVLPQVLAVLAAAIGGSALLLRVLSGHGAAERRGRQAATVLLMSHFIAEGLRNALTAALEGEEQVGGCE